MCFRNNIDLNELNKYRKLELTLVDHHILSEDDANMSESVMKVIDHRPIDPSISVGEDKRVIEQVGSCCTLVANIMLNYDGNILNKELAHLLHSTIVLDTVNFNVEAKRYQQLDLDIVIKLEKLFDITESRESIHSQLTRARSDVSTLTAYQVGLKHT